MEAMVQVFYYRADGTIGEILWDEIEISVVPRIGEEISIDGTYDRDETVPLLGSYAKVTSVSWDILEDKESVHIVAMAEIEA